MQEQWVYVNGEHVLKEDAKVSVYDHGFLYGDGVFEGIRVYNGNVYRLDEHLQRLYESAQSIMLTIPHTKEELTDIIVQTLQKNKYRDAYIRLVISRGKGNLGLDPFTCGQPGVIVIAEQLALFPKKLYETGLEIITVASRRNRPDVLSPKVKSLNYLNNILVKIEASLAGVSEALMLNDQGYVAEGSADNVFIIKGNTIKTPPGYLGALEGITRNAIVEIARAQGYNMVEEPFTRHDVYVADEVFLTGTAAEVIAVVKVDGRVIGNGAPGEHTNKLLKSFREKVVEEGVKVYPNQAVQAG
ncbi:branched-chain-amino-acid transaminase [Fictibacillus sp. 5RED26]|jgi:branched-chain amino acid aminotransferase|uniref:branched-chain-amino-acid transaminase n=1 Tax=Fictibacillus TaxID=1329200 RepID=UPI0012938BF8|nr:MULTISPECIES: branched-chain-amino-acid transaminase [Fictibacillus]MBH0157749.1 branched-chain-amino-acid transaminase [Fictibacillus sp. 5RED26]MBH0159898.1 branched-chain-amino-acid transaminase [Fictibacillus sp. 26RED30]MBH0163350.1 branched-chain-amino-acid transaminase [Fictibacillus sp. 7GRE50]MBH0175145.1 branched-chain-amino-acid transaminase [Fictibacillus sp. 23RED33]MQR95372.1 branched-chain-amino-acid transaminase [Fictibacillus phosphorivorans]